MGKLFEERMRQTIDEIGFAYFTYDESEFWMYEKIYKAIEKYANDHEYFNTALSLKAVRGLYNGTYSSEVVKKDGKSYQMPYIQHCLSVCKILIDIRLPLSDDERDIVLASALCHGLIANIFFTERGKEMVDIYHLDPRVYEVMQLVTRKKYLSEGAREKFFEDLQKNKLALLVRMADRSNYVEQLYNIPIWRAREYIHETRTYYFPMCFYAKEYYPELIAAFSIFLEKMRNLLEVTEIMVGRFENREIELSKEILALKEENARIRGIIKRKKAQASIGNS
ncbi:MAG: hypothetical protein Q4E53_08185 [Eubacteriales bacterium]|nr:hypothetical protein [Eubacteriales bacterium]